MSSFTLRFRTMDCSSRSLNHSLNTRNQFFWSCSLPKYCWLQYWQCRIDSKTPFKHAQVISVHFKAILKQTYTSISSSYSKTFHALLAAFKLVWLELSKIMHCRWYWNRREDGFNKMEDQKNVCQKLPAQHFEWPQEYSQDYLLWVT